MRGGARQARLLQQNPASRRATNVHYCSPVMFLRGDPMRILFALMANFVFMILSVPTIVHGQTDLEARAKEQGQSLVREHVAWRTRLSSPGASIRVKEVGRQGSLVSYNLYVLGLPTGELYTAVSWPVTQAKPAAIMEGVSLGKDEIVMCAGRAPEQSGDASKKDDPIDFALDAAKGEPYRLA